MRILLTFEDGRVALHFRDVINTLKHFGHQIDYYDAGEVKMPEHHLPLYNGNLNVITELTDLSKYNLWIYDLTSWSSPVSPLVEQMERFSGRMICIGEGDGAGFLIERTSMKVVEKTNLFMRNTLFKNKSFYHPAIWHKMFLSTCYITNSQDFKNVIVPFKEKQKRAIFTGSLTGFSEDGNRERELARIKIPMALINAGVPCVYRLHNHNPQWKEFFDKNVPEAHKTTALDRPDFIKEMSTSMIVLAIRGNYHTVNRFFEGQASGGLVFTTRFKEDAEFYGHGDPGVHYVEIEWDGSDVVEKARYYLEHVDEAEVIANNGRKLWEEHSMLDDSNLLPQRVLDYYVQGIRSIGGIDISCK